MKKYFLNAVFLGAFICFSFFARAETSQGFPAKEIFIQFFNFSIFAGLLFFFLQKPLKAFFHKRKKDFLAFEEQTASLEKEKKEELALWEGKLKSLKEQEANIRQRATAEGDKLIFQKKQQLEQLRSQLEKTADFLFHLEEEKSKRDLIKKWRGQVARSAEEELKRQAVSLDFQKNMLEVFLKQIEKSHL